MFLNQLTLLRGNNLIRKITFKRGLNLILDSPTDNQTQTGNSVGKSTALRVVDFCLGSEGDDIWQDPEFKKNNDELIRFLTDGEPIVAQLEIESANGVKHQLSRTFKAPSGGKFIAKVDGEIVSRLTEYNDVVRTILFGSPGPKPTLRQLMPKFVRSSPNKMNKTLLFLGDYTDKSVYESVYLFLFGFFNLSVLERRPKLVRELKRIERDLTALKRLRSEGELDQLIRHLQSEISSKEETLHRAGESIDFAKNIKEIGAIRENAANVSTRLTGLETELNYQKKTIREFEKNKSEVDLNYIRNVYEEAKAFLPNLQKEFSEVSEFIQALHTRKIDYLKARLPETEAIIAASRAELAILTKREELALQPVRDELLSTDINSVRDQLRNDYLQMGALKEAALNFKKLQHELFEMEKQLALTQQQLTAEKNTLQESVEKFNSHFTKLSQSLYEEAYLLHFDEGKGGSFQFSITDVGSNVGTGKKATQTAAFDLAYMKFLAEMNFGFPRFALHDGLESIHDNQLAALLNEADLPSGQLIVATLRDKLPKLDGEFLKKNTVLELSEDNKFFNF